MYCYERLRDLREDADLTQKEVGALLHTTQQQDAKYELGVQENPDTSSDDTGGERNWKLPILTKK